MSWKVACFCGTYYIGVVCPGCGRCALPKVEAADLCKSCTAPLSAAEKRAGSRCDKCRLMDRWMLGES